MGSSRKSPYMGVGGYNVQGFRISCVQGVKCLCPGGKFLLSRGLLWHCPEGLILQIVLGEEIMSRVRSLYSIRLRGHNREYEINLRKVNFFPGVNFYPIAGEEAREDTLSR